MTAFDKAYWESHWQRATGSGRSTAPSPYLATEVGTLPPGAALDAGCGEGAEAIWLAAHGWCVTAVDISVEALTSAAERAHSSDAAERLRWVEADLGAWEPGRQFDLVTTHYAHPAMSQLAFYRRISEWVAPGGTLLIVGHLRSPDATGHAHKSAEDAGRGHGHEPDKPGLDEHGSDEHGDHPPEAASVSAASITEQLRGGTWDVVTADERVRTLPGREGGQGQLRDVVVRATRRA